MAAAAEPPLPLPKLGKGVFMQGKGGKGGVRALGCWVMVSIPKPEDVTAYLAQYQIESVIEEAVNDAVLKQVKNPYLHIADLLVKHSKKTMSSGAGIEEESFSKAKFAEGVQVLGDDGDKAKVTGEELDRTYVKKQEVQLKPELEQMLKTFFSKMDVDGDGTVTKDEAIKFWGSNFAKVNANSMFNEVDEDGNGSVSWDEFTDFWKNVVGSGYSEEDLIEEVEMMLEGGSWVDFNDGRTT